MGGETADIIPLWWEVGYNIGVMEKANMKFWIWGCGIAVAIYAVFRHLFTDSINFSVWACIAGLIVAVVAEKYIPPIRRSLRNRERKLMLSVACPAFVVAVDISISDTPLYANVAVALLTFVIAFYAVRGVKNIDDERGLMKLITGCFTVCVLSGMFALLIYEGASRSDQTLLWIAVGAMATSIIGLIIRFIISIKKEKQQ